MRFPSFNVELYLKIVCSNTFFRNSRKNFPSEIANFLKYLFQLLDIAHDDAIYLLRQKRCRSRKKKIQFLEDQNRAEKWSEVVLISLIFQKLRGKYPIMKKK